MNKIDIEKQLEKLKDSAIITICHNTGIYVYEGFFAKDIINCPENNCIKCLVDNRIIKYDNIKSIEQNL